MIERSLRRFSLLALLIAVAACSRGQDAEPVAALDSTFHGFRLLTPAERVMADARGSGLYFGCDSVSAEEAFCPGELEPAAGKPVMSFIFRGGRLVGLVRSPAKEKGAPPTGDMAAQFQRAFGAPVVEGWLNAFLHARMWTDADTSVIGVLTCEKPSDRTTCEAGLDHAAGTNLPQILDDWRGMIERHAASGQPPIKEPGSRLP
jgi:hypothetical protein